MAMSSGEMLFSMFSHSDKDFMKGVVTSFYIVDYGIITSVNADKTVDVVHAVKPVMQDGSVLDVGTNTKGVEVLWPSSKEFSFKHTLTKGDRVLLLGLKACLPTVDVTDTIIPDVGYSYSQETLKAVPACLFNSSASLKVEVDGGAMKLSNQVNSLKSVLNELLDALTTGWVSINCVVGSPVTPLPTTITAINAARTKLNTLFKD